MSSQTNPLRSPSLPLPWLTVERALWGSLLCVTALSRLIGLADAPLSVPEAERALAGWNLVKGVAPAWWDAPALGGALWLLLFTLGDADLVARLLPALAGVALVAAPWWWRSVLGPMPALLAGALLAVSPALWVAARTTHEATLAILVVLALARIAAAGLVERDRDRMLAAGGLALLVNLGAPGVSGLLALGAFTALRHAAWPTGQQPPRPMTGPWAMPLATFVLTHIMLSTALLHHAAGFGVPSLAAWITAATPPPGDAASVSPLLLLAGLEPLALLAGVPAAIVTVVRWLRVPTDLQAAILGLLAVWALLALVPALTGGQPSAPALAPSVAAFTLITAAVLGRACRDLRLPSPGSLVWLGGALLFLLTFAYLGFARAANASGSGLPLIGWLGLVAGALVLARAALLAPRPRALLAAGALGFGGAFSLHATGSMANFNLRPFETRIERAGVDEVYDRTAMQALRESGRNRTVAISSELSFAYAWALRDIATVTYAAAPPATADVLVLPEAPNQPHPTGYQRAVLPLTQRWQQGSGSALDTWRWAVWGRPAPDAWQYQRAMLYTKDAG